MAEPIDAPVDSGYPSRWKCAGCNARIAVDYLHRAILPCAACGAHGAYGPTPEEARSEALLEASIGRAKRLNEIVSCSERIVQAIVADLADRGGLGGVWSEIDDLVKNQITLKWQVIILENSGIESLKGGE